MQSPYLSSTLYIVKLIGPFTLIQITSCHWPCAERFVILFGINFSQGLAVQISDAMGILCHVDVVPSSGLWTRPSTKATNNFRTYNSSSCIFRNMDGGQLSSQTRQANFTEASENGNRKAKVGLAWPPTESRAIGTATRYMNLFLSFLFLSLPARI